jgi:hypothetical protein
VVKQLVVISECVLWLQHHHTSEWRLLLLLLVVLLFKICCIPDVTCFDSNTHHTSAGSDAWVALLPNPLQGTDFMIELACR